LAKIERDGWFKMSENKHRTIIVGGGMSGLTAAVYLARAGHDIFLLEKNKDCGGLLNSFTRDGFTFDAGARSILNAGIIHPMLRELDIRLEFLESPVSIGIENDIINLTSENAVDEYRKLLERLYPESVDDIKVVISKIESIMKDMQTMYKIDNPNFREQKDGAYLKQLLGWLPGFIRVLGRMGKQSEPVESYLKKLN
jgi:phytoene dehydrogenase-like protein